MANDETGAGHVTQLLRDAQERIAELQAERDYWRDQCERLRDRLDLANGEAATSRRVTLAILDALEPEQRRQAIARARNVADEPSD